jgi:DNA-binding PadR family transcriptional regulator
MSLRHFVLGMLVRQPMSGYDIKGFLKSLSWLVDSPSFGSLYPALHSLLEDDLVTMEVVPQEDRPPRKIYSITPAGEDELASWIEETGSAAASLKAFVLRMILVGNLSQNGIISHLEQRRTQVAEQQQVLKATAGDMDKQTSQGERLAFDYGLAVAAAELAWIDHTLARLAEAAPLPE